MKYITLNNGVKMPILGYGVYQMETHVFWQQKGMREFLKKYGTQLESWASFAEGKKDMFRNPVLMEVAGRHNKSVAQVILRFFIQIGVVQIPVAKGDSEK